MTFSRDVSSVCSTFFFCTSSVVERRLVATREATPTEGVNAVVVVPTAARRPSKAVACRNIMVGIYLNFWDSVLVFYDIETFE
mmetsp:Transcript_17248/g.37743  ORF Transcript_17248/g.37743 Transcript_17248/m.37743 type:complete len:83 (-) Transcript_17248:71-319(-)